MCPATLNITMEASASRRARYHSDPRAPCGRVPLQNALVSPRRQRRPGAYESEELAAQGRGRVEAFLLANYRAGDVEDRGDVRAGVVCVLVEAA